MKHKKIILSSIIIIALLITTYSLKNFSKSENPIIDTKNHESMCTTLLDKLGWKHSDKPIEIEKVIIPDEFNDTYKKYNDLQKKQNFNLEKYRGKTCLRFTYKITNYKEYPECVHANILLYKNKIIGADISSIRLNGFMHEITETKNQL